MVTKQPHPYHAPVTQKFSARQLIAYLAPCRRARDTVESRFREVDMGLSSILTINR